MKGSESLDIESDFSFSQDRLLITGANMAYNLLVTYDLDKPGQNYDAVHAKIKSLGKWYHPQFSVFYIHTALSARDAHAAIAAVMDGNDKLIVADVTNIIIARALDADIAAINAVWFAAA
jgi:hypothetical protein